MKRTLYVGYCLFVFIFGYSQTQPSDGSERKKESKPLSETSFIFTQPNINAEFKGGKSLWATYLQNNINNDVLTKNLAPKGRYDVIVSFIITPTGKVDSVRALNNPGFGTAEEAVRVVKNSPDWNPSLQHGRTTSFKCLQRITFIGVEELVKKDSTNGETNTSNIQKLDTVKAKFVGGKQKWVWYLQRNLRADVPAKNNAPEGTYTVDVHYMVSPTGTIDSVNAMTDPGYGTAEEAVRLIKNSPKWIPASVNGKPIWYSTSQKISFVKR